MNPSSSYLWLCWQGAFVSSGAVTCHQSGLLFNEAALRRLPLPVIPAPLPHPLPFLVFLLIEHNTHHSVKALSPLSSIHFPKKREREVL